MQKVYKCNRSITRRLRLATEALASQLLPGICLICRESVGMQEPLCQYCLDSVKPPQQPLRCLRCAVKLDVATDHTTDNNPLNSGLYCADCIQQPPEFDRCIAATCYSRAAALLINQLKHNAFLASITPLSQLLIDEIRSHYPNPHTDIDLVIPVPLHRNRIKQRGFNQANELAKPLCRTFDLPLAANYCHRIIDGQPQQQLGLTERKRNLEHAFEVIAEVKGLRIAVVDDVVTTTTTANAISRSLLKAGAARCDIWCFARTPS